MAARSNSIGVVCTGCGEVARVEAAELARLAVFRCPSCGAQRALSPTPRSAGQGEGWSAPVFGENYAARAPRQPPTR